MIDAGLVALAVAVVGGFIVAFILGWRVRKGDIILEKVVKAIVGNFLDERKFSVEDLKQITGLDERVIEPALERLRRAGLLMRKGNRWLLKDPLVFLTERDYVRAVRITKDDNILYGAYQNPYLPRLYLLLIYLVVAIDVVFVVITYLSYLIGWPSPDIAGWVINHLLPKHDSSLLLPFLLFLLGMGVIFVDFVDNVIKAWARERFSVVVGALSGISYDRSFADELSGRIRRGQIENVDYDISLFQKIINYFRRVPLGDVKVWVRGQEKPIVFKNMPYPREFYYVIRSVQLGSLQWRKKHAETLMLWRARAALPSVRGGRR